MKRKGEKERQEEEEDEKKGEDLNYKHRYVTRTPNAITYKDWKTATERV